MVAVVAAAAALVPAPLPAHLAVTTVARLSLAVAATVVATSDDDESLSCHKMAGHCMIVAATSHVQVLSTSRTSHFFKSAHRNH